MTDKSELLKAKVSLLSQDDKFIHHKWFLKYHLSLVEQISLELLKRYPGADIDILLGLVWIHDYAKIIGIKDEKEGITKSKSFMLEMGLEEEYVKKVIGLLEIFESKMTMDLSKAPMEVRIVSTADAVSHMYGPFYHLYYYENSNMSVEELKESNMRKLEKDWNRKIAFPEIRDELKQRYNFLMESFGEIPGVILKKDI